MERLPSGGELTLHIDPTDRRRQRLFLIAIFILLSKDKSRNWFSMIMYKENEMPPDSQESGGVSFTKN